MLRCYLFILLQITSISLWAQIPQKQLGIPPSPDVASLGKFVDIPVNYYNGLADISIPVHTVSAGDLSFPITLSYHASGLKVEEIASWVGAGWSLSTEGVIGRTIRGSADEGSNGYFSQKPSYVLSDKPFNSQGQIIIDDKTSCDPHESFSEGSYRQHFRYLRDCFDTEPDLFFFSIPGAASGKFVFDTQGNIFHLPHQNIKIIPPNFEISNLWKIILPNGTQYLFEKMEKTKVGVTCGSSPDTPICSPPTYNTSAWKLVKIISASGKHSITFEYEEEKIYYLSPASVSISTNLWKNINNPNPLPLDTYPSSFCLKQKNWLTTQKIKRILSSSGERIEFVKNSEERKDLTGGQALQEVQIYFKNRFIKKYVFETDYFEASPGQYSPSDPSSNYTLRLQSLQEFNAQMQALPSHKFSYKGNHRPSRHSFDVDYWGYFNGAGNSRKCGLDNVEKRFSNIIYEYGNRVINLEGGDKGANSDYAQLGILTKIEYPTGGTTSFEYALHKYKIINEENKKLQHHDYTFEHDYTEFATHPNHTIRDTFQLNQARYVNFIYRNPYNGSCWNPFAYLRLIKNGQVIKEFLGSTTTLCPWGDKTELEAGEYIVEAQLKSYNCNCNATGGSTISDGSDPSSQSHNPYGGCAVTAVSNVAEPGCTMCGETPTIPAELTFFPGDRMYLRIVWESELLSVNQETEGGGLRIRKITHYDDYNPEKNLVKLYTYQGGKHRIPIYLGYIVNQNGGVTPTTIVYGNGQSQDMTHFNRCSYEPDALTPGANTVDAITYVRISKGHMPLTTMVGGFVGYDQVTVRQENIAGAYGENGKEVFYYSNPINSGDIYKTGTYPFVSPSITDYNYGRLLKHEVYATRNNDPFSPEYSLLKVTEHSYARQAFKASDGIIYGPSNPHQIWGFEYAQTIMSACKNCTHTGYASRTYTEESQWVALQESKTRLYDKYGKYTDSKLTYSFYDRFSLAVKEMKRTGDGGDIIIQKFKYPYDYASGTNPALDTMVHRHIITVPIEQQTWLKRSGLPQKLLSSAVSEFQLKNDYILPKKMYALENAQSLNSIDFIELKNVNDKYTELLPNSSDSSKIQFQAQGEYLAFDEKGNLLSTQPTDGVTSAYIWGYNKDFPMAEVLNASPEQIAYTSFEEGSLGEGNWIFPAYTIAEYSIPLNDSLALGSVSNNISITHSQSLKVDYELLVNDTLPDNYVYTHYPSIILKKNGVLQEEKVLNNVALLGTVYFSVEEGTYTLELSYSGTDNAYQTSSNIRSSFEEWIWSAPYQSYEDAKTGFLSANCSLKKETLPMGTYRLSAWVKGTGNIPTISLSNVHASIHNKTPTISPNNEWQYMEWEVVIPPSDSSDITFTPEANTQIDEVRLAPKSAQMTTYTYEPKRHQLYQTIDLNHRFVQYEYDAFGRLLLLRDDENNILKTYDYHYRRDNN